MTSNDGYPPNLFEWGHARYLQGWEDGHAAGLRDAADNQHAAAIHAEAITATRAAADRIGPEHDERRARETAGRAKARERWTTPKEGAA